IRNVGIIRGRVVMRDVVRSCGFDDPISLEPRMDVVTVIRIRLFPVVAQKLYLTETTVCFDVSQRDAKSGLFHEPVLEFNKFRRFCVWITDFDLEELTRRLLDAATENNHSDYC